MAATATKATTIDDLRNFLSDQEITVKDILSVVPMELLQRAWVSGEIEFGRTKYCLSGNPESPRSHPTVILEGGIDWSGPKTTRHGRLAQVLAEKLPTVERYQRYQREVQVNREKDVWEWVESEDDIKGRETRWARRASDRKEAEALFQLHVRLTEKGLAAIQ